ncbi:protein BIG GRAIN 1-like A [Primulina tabacum]|uniref:protein BIG GRAIN 1-like A n=1 Tax=Primulina tabacum TaxID=48773 RepID=UPI003F599E03
MYVSNCSSNYPSFSSTLLDSIYRSFDIGEEGMGIYREPINKSTAADVFPSDQEEMANFQRVCMIEKLMEKRVGDKGVSRRKLSEARKWRKDGDSFSFSSSSDSSSGGGEADEISFPGATSRRPKPIRTGSSGHHQKEKSRENRQDFEMNRRERRGLADQSEPNPKHESGFLKTKSKALKIYADLKKVKQPISPGRKLATFLNSLFTTAAGSSKKHKANANPHHSLASKSANTSTCSSASSFSRSCLGKPPSSTGKFSSVAKRSVNFFPGSVIDDEDCQPCGRKALPRENKPINAALYSELVKNNFNGFNSIKSSIDEELKVYVMEYNRRVEDAAMDFLRKTHFTNRVFDQESEEEDEDDDMESCASSDLFELDNLSTIGVERYRKELPVYETTSADAKRVVIN